MRLFFLWLVGGSMGHHHMVLQLPGMDGPSNILVWNEEEMGWMASSRRGLRGANWELLNVYVYTHLRVS